MITIVTTKYCPYCNAAKWFLDSLGKEYTNIDVTSDRDTRAKYSKISGMTTVPQIFDGNPSKGTLIGGYDDMMSQYDSGKIFQ